MNVRDGTLTIEVPLALHGVPDYIKSTDVTDDLERMLNSDKQGRYQFDAEMFRLGLLQNLHMALNNSIGRHFIKLYGEAAVEKLKETSFDMWSSLNMIGKITFKENDEKLDS